MKSIEVTCQHLLSGIGRYGLELSNQLHSNGIAGTFYKPFKKGHPDSACHEQSWVKPVRYKSFRNLHPYLLPLFIRNAIETDKKAVLHAHWFLSGLAISTFRANPKVVTMHDVSLLHHKEQNSSYLRYYEWAIKRFRDLEIPLIVVSENAKRDTLNYASYPEELVHVVYNGINHDQFFPEHNEALRPTNRFRIVYSGGLGKRKNVGLLLRAMMILEDRGEEVELIISGAHPERTAYPAMARDMGLQQVHFTGFIDDHLMADFYRSGHLMVFPSEYEGFGLAPLESMACGTPVLSAKGGALQETSGEGAMYFDYEAEDLAAKIKLLKEDSSRRQQFTERGLKQAAQYTWKKTADQTAALYRMIA